MAQSIYFGGPILTMEEPLYAQALVEEDGVIRYVGQLEHALELAGPQARKVDLEGRCLMPAFLDPHSHFMACANSLLQVQLGECADQEELCRRLGPEQEPSMRQRKQRSTPQATPMTRMIWLRGVRRTGGCWTGPARTTRWSFSTPQVM